MKINWDQSPVTGTWTVLGDESDRTQTIRNYKPRRRSLVQTTPMFQAENQQIAPLLNKIWTLSFDVERTHASLDAALAFQYTHPAGLPDFITLQIIQGTTTLYLVTAVLTEFDIVPEGVSSVSSYALTGIYTNVAP
ncbi:MAG: hypothetical protein KGL39_17795 [Patescibacteria group bacterium]|nr:hypothetical protein [Patescibacteria group bacterium]